MEKKIKVKICTGTNCYVLGGASLLMLEEYLDDFMKEKVEISGANCMDYCKNQKMGKPPFVMINEKIISNASIPKIIDELRKIISETKE